MKKPTVNYVDNKEFLALLIKYKTERDECIKNNKTLPIIPNEIGHIIIQLANRISTRFNFVNYTYRDEMVSDGILNAVEAVHKFKIEKSSNPFGYFGKIIWWAFARRITKEKRDHKMRDEIMFDINTEFYSSQEGQEYNVSSDETYLWYNQ
jgi:hypothetical protein